MSVCSIKVVDEMEYEHTPKYPCIRSVDKNEESSTRTCLVRYYPGTWYTSSTAEGSAYELGVRNIPATSKACKGHA